MLTAVLISLVPGPATAGGCGDLPVSVDCGASADPPGGYFHGLIGVTGQDWVLELASRAGSSAGCGDCVWTITLDCPQASPENPDDTTGCAGMTNTTRCPPGALPYRLYLSTTSVTNQLTGDICLGGGYRVILVGADADADVARYVRDVTPPDLVIHRRPHGATLTGLPTFFRADPPAGLGPVGFGGPTVTETITLIPQQVSWAWGDGESSGWLALSTTAEHRYLSGGVVTGTLTVRWGASYTATFEGHTVGPFTATGTVDRRQPFVEPVDTSRPALISR
jgi:hypothetical protein